ncbi:MAG: biotin/lipoate--protein ligase family protein [Alphaproteobacteria bacterium]
MDRHPQFPPIYRPIRLTELDAHMAAVEAARGGAEAATLLWVDRKDAIDCAVILRPDGGTKYPETIAYAGMVAVAEALGGLLPEQAPVAFEWPDRVLVNDGCIGGTRLAAATTTTAAELPAWMVWSVLLAVESDPEDEPGHHPNVTTLGDEFAYDELFSITDLLEGIARHFLRWTMRWQEDGFAPVRRAWMERALGHHEQPIARRVFFRVEAIDDDGTVTLRREGVQRILTIAQGMKRRSWWLPDRFGASRALAEVGEKK